MNEICFDLNDRCEDLYIPSYNIVLADKITILTNMSSVVSDDELLNKFNYITDLLRECKKDISLCVDVEFMLGHQHLGFFKWLKNTNITSLNLQGHKLGCMADNQWQEFFVGLKDTNITSLNLAGNDLCRIGYLQGKRYSSYGDFLSVGGDKWQAFFLGLKDSKVTSINFAGNNLAKMSVYQWQAFFVGLKDSKVTIVNLSGNGFFSMENNKWKVCNIGLGYSNLISIDLSHNNLNLVHENRWNEIIDTFKNSGIYKINKIDFGSAEIKKLSAARKQDLAELHLTKIPSDRYQNMNILQFAYMVYSLNCKITGSPNDPSNDVIKKTWLVGELLLQNILKTLTIDTVQDILESIPASDGIFQTPIKRCKESYGLIRQIYNDNAQLRTICVAHSESFMSPIAEFLKAIDINHADIIKSYLHDLNKIDRNILYNNNTSISQIIANILDNKDRLALDIISKEQNNITILQLKSIKLIASQYNKQEIVTSIEKIINLRDSVATSILNLCISGKKELINESLIDICKSNNLEYQEDDQLKLFIQNIIETYQNIKNADKPKIVAEITQQILTNIERSAVVSDAAEAGNGAATSHVSRVIEQRAEGSRQTEL
jgi:hypothetical protein